MEISYFQSDCTICKGYIHDVTDSDMVISVSFELMNTRTDLQKIRGKMSDELIHCQMNSLQKPRMERNTFFTFHHRTSSSKPESNWKRHLCYLMKTQKQNESLGKGEIVYKKGITNSKNKRLRKEESSYKNISHSFSNDTEDSYRKGRTEKQSSQFWKNCSLSIYAKFPYWWLLYEFFCFIFATNVFFSINCVLDQVFDFEYPESPWFMRYEVSRAMKWHGSQNATG